MLMIAIAVFSVVVKAVRSLVLALDRKPGLLCQHLYQRGRLRELVMYLNFTLSKCFSVKTQCGLTLGHQRPSGSAEERLLLPSSSFPGQVTGQASAPC